MELYLGPFYKYFDYFWKFKNKQTKELIYFDFETTGLNPYHDKIIEYCFILEEKCEYDLKNPDSFNDNYYITEMVDPKTKFEKKISNITGIYPEDLEDKQPISVHIDIIDNFICDKNNNNTESYLVAHNCDCFDKLFLINNFKKYNNDSYIKWKFIDTLHLSKKLVPNLKSYSLKYLCEYFNLQSGNHRALSDTISLRNLYHELMRIISIKLDLSVNYLLDNPQIVHKYIY